MPRLRARAILLAEAERLADAERLKGQGPEALRIAVWRLDAGGRPDPAGLVRGGQPARDAHDFRGVRRPIQAAPPRRPEPAGAPPPGAGGAPPRGSGAVHRAAP